MNRWLLSAVAAFGLSACGADVDAACQDYVEAAELCAEGVGVSSGVPSNYCQSFEGLTGAQARETADQFTCFANVIRGGDCSTPEDARNTLTLVAQCQ